MLRGYKGRGKGLYNHDRIFRGHWALQSSQTVLGRSSLHVLLCWIMLVVLMTMNECTEMLSSRTLYRGPYENSGLKIPSLAEWQKMWKALTSRMPQVRWSHVLHLSSSGFSSVSRLKPRFFSLCEMKQKSQISQWHEECIPKCVFLMFCGNLTTIAV